MKLGKLDLSNWTFGGRKLSNVFVILRRLCALPLLLLGKAVVVFAVLCGWGLEDAKDAWSDLP